MFTIVSDRNPTSHCFINSFSGGTQILPSTATGTQPVVVLYIHSIEEAIVYYRQCLEPHLSLFYTSILWRKPEFTIVSDLNPTWHCGINSFSGGSQSLPSTMSEIPLVIVSYIHSLVEATVYHRQCLQSPLSPRECMYKNTSILWRKPEFTINWKLRWDVFFFRSAHQR